VINSPFPPLPKTQSVREQRPYCVSIKLRELDESNIQIRIRLEVVMKEKTFGLVMWATKHINLPDSGHSAPKSQGLRHGFAGACFNHLIFANVNTNMVKSHASARHGRMF
jgi:hypothetical protein